MMADRAVFLDRDNTLIDNDGDLGDPDRVRLLEGVAPALARLRDAGYRLVVVSNQGGVARGVYGETDVDAVNRRIASLVDEASGRCDVIDRFYYCPYHPQGAVDAYRREHPWRKPRPGMLHAARQELGLDLGQSWLVGDQPRDVAAGRAAGCATILVSADPAAVVDARPTAVVRTLSEAADIILRRVPTDPPIPSSVRSLLIVCPSWVGDTIMATPLLRAAREALPQARIIAACRHGLDELLAGSPWLDEVFAGETKTTRGMFGLARRLRRLAPEAAILLPNSFRSALLARLAGAARRVGYIRYGRSVLLSRGLAPPRQKLPVGALGYYARLGAWALGTGPIDPRMQLFVTDDQRTTAARLLAGVGRPYVLLCPGANKAAKRWPADRFARVADSLSRGGLAVAVTGSPGERGIVAEVADAAGVTVCDLAQRGITLGSLKAVIADAALMVTNDTGPRHIAAAVGTPVVTLFGPTDHRWTTIECPHERILVADPFLPESLVADDHARHCAISRIPVADVLAAAEQLLAASPPADPEAHDASPASTPAG